MKIMNFEKKARNKTSRGALQSTLMMLVVCFIVVFSANLVSAADWDNVYNYDEETKTATVENWLGLGPDLAYVTLTSPMNVMVMRGEDRLVGEFNFTTTGDFIDTFGDIYLTDLKNDNVMSRGSQFKYKQYKEISVDDYELVCEDVILGNGTAVPDCHSEEVGSHMETQVEWIPIANPNNEFLEGVTYEVGVFVDVNADDYGDWVPSIMGVEIEEWATWTESFNVDIVSYWACEDSAGTALLDSLEANNFVTTNMDEGVTGKILLGVNNSGIGYGVVNEADFDFGFSDFTVNVWVFISEFSSAGGNTPFLGTQTAGNTVGWSFYHRDDGLVRFDMGNGSAVSIRSQAGLATAGVWQMMTITKTGTVGKIYKNGTEIASYSAQPSAPAGITNSGRDLWLSTQDQGNPDSTIQGTLDEIGVWNRSLNDSEILNLFNDNVGLTYVGVFGVAPDVTLTSPADNANLTSVNIDFISTVTDDLQVDNVTLYIDGVANETNSSGFNGTYTFSKVISEGVHNWSILAIDNQSLENQSATRDFNLTIPPIFIDLLSPTDVTTHETPVVNMSCTAYKDEGVTQLNLTIDGVVNITIVNTTVAENLTISQDLYFSEGNYTWGCSATNPSTSAVSSNRTFEVLYSSPIVTLVSPDNDSSVLIENVTFLFNATDVNGIDNVTLYINGAANETNTSGVDGNYSIFKTLIDGIYNWSVSATSILGKTTSSATRIFTLHTTLPIVNISSPSGTEGYFLLGENETLVYNVSEIGENLTEHLDSCWYSYNGANASLNCSASSTTFLYVESINTITIYANDSFGFMGENTSTWEYTLLETGQTFNNATMEGATEEFTINFTKLSGDQISTVNFVYNETAYSSPYVATENKIIAQSTITIPRVDADTNFTFYWNVTLDDDSVITTDSNNQSVSNINVDNCSAYTNLIYNLTQFDEETKDILTNNNTIELQINLYDTKKTVLLTNFSSSFTNVNPVQFCMEDPILTNANFSSYVIVKYYANTTTTNVSHSIEYYNILNQTIGNTTVPINVDLYDLKTEDTTKFQLTFRDSSYVLAPNVLVQVHRQYIEDNDFKIVEIPLTDSNGQTILNLVKDTIIYNFVMVNEAGQVVGTFNSIVAFCQDFVIGDCQINLAPDSDSPPVYDYDEEFDISISTPTYSNSTEKISITFLTGDLLPKTVRMDIVRNNDFGNRSVCTDSLLSSSGTVSCSVAAVTDIDQFLFISTYVDGELAQEDTINLNADSLNFGTTNGAFYAFLLILALTTLFMEDRKVLTISLGLGWVGVLSLGLVSGKLIGFSSAGIWLLVTIFIFLWKLNKEDEQ